MKETGQMTSDIFKNTSIQLNSEEVMELNGNPDRFSGIYKDLAEILGDAATIKIWKHFAGLNITFPQKLYSRDFRKEFIVKNMGKMKPGDIAKKLGLTERRVRQIIAEIQKENNL